MHFRSAAFYSLFSKCFPPIYLNMERGSTLGAVPCSECVKKRERKPPDSLTYFNLFLISFCLTFTEVYKRKHTHTNTL